MFSIKKQLIKLRNWFWGEPLPEITWHYDENGKLVPDRYYNPDGFNVIGESYGPLTPEEVKKLKELAAQLDNYPPGK